MYVDWPDWNKEYQRTRRSWHWYNIDCGSTTHIDDGIESLEQITEAINSSTENIKEQYMNNYRDTENIKEQYMNNRDTENIKEQYMNNRDTENITGNINDNVIEKVVEEQMMENCRMKNLYVHNNLD